MVLQFVYRSCLFNPFLSRNVVVLFDLFHFPFCDVNFASLHQLDFNMLLYNLCFCLEQNHCLIYPEDIIVVVQEPFHDPCFVTENHPRLLPNILNRQYLGEKV